MQEDHIELRDYSPSILAQNVVAGDFEGASSRAFRTLFRYIDGENQARDKIAMTAPVSQERASEKIAMTAPVSQQASGEGWVVSFMMPASYTIETIPQPLDPNVSIRLVPAWRAAAIRYSGRWTDENYQRHLGELLEWMEDQDIEASGAPVWARYNAPFTPWFLRRNEILIPVEANVHTETR